jgi:hypothetical protein
MAVYAPKSLMRSANQIAEKKEEFSPAAYTLA